MENKEQASKKEQANQAALRTVCLSQGTLTYHHTQKKVKNLNLRVKPDGSIHVSSPHKTSLKYVDNFVKSNENFIFRALEKFKNLSKKPKIKLEDSYRIEEGKPLYFMGYAYTVQVRQSLKNEIEVDSETMVFIVNSTYPQNGQKTQEIVDKWIKKQALILFEDLCQTFYPQFEKYQIPWPKIQTRKMKARWGSCNFSKKTVTFAHMLLHAPQPCMEYVVVHELAHLAEPNHSRDFYQIVEDILPDWQARRQLLREFASALQSLRKMS